MKRLIVTSILALFIAGPAFGQPTPEPETKAPVTKVETKTDPATKVLEPTKDEPEVKVAGELKVVGEVPKAEEKPAAAPVEPQTEPEGMSYGAVAIKYAMQLGFLLLSLLLSGFVTVLLKKFGFQAQNEKIQDILTKAAAFAEQWSMKKAKLDGAIKPGGPEKMEQAISIALAMAKEYKLPEKGKDWWEERLESWLGVKNGG